MRYQLNPDDEFDREVLDEIQPEPWMLEALKLNPDYVFWGPDEDYMAVRGQGWDSALEFDSWEGCDWSLDDLNEVVHFYFEIGEGPRLRFVFWALHPRKGASRGVRINNVREDQVAEICRWLAEADDRNRERFAAARARGAS